MIGAIDKFSAQDLIAGKAERLAAAAGGASTAKEKEKVAQEFVALLFLEVLKVMRSAIPKGGLFESDSLQSDIYTTMGDTEIARTLAGREAMGLRKMVEKALDRSQLKTLDPRAAPAAGLSSTRENSPPELGAPASGAVSSGFGVRPDPWTGENRFHKGLDIAARPGSPVKAAAAGKVIFSGRADGYGNLVTIDHGDGVVTRYGHNEVNLVGVGDQVGAEQEIALVGATGRSKGPHLHFEVHRNGQAVDPMQVLGLQGEFNISKKG